MNKDGTVLVGWHKTSPYGFVMCLCCVWGVLLRESVYHNDVTTYFIDN